MIEEDLKNYPPILSVTNLKEILGVSEHIVRKMVSSEGFPTIDRNITGRRILVPKQGFIKWLERQSKID